MRPLYLNCNIVQLKTGNLGDAQPAAAGQADDDAVTPIVGRPPGPGRQVGEDGRKLTTTQ
jgi:hypothetical protein